jgi:ELWxxDGT repeat protein
LAEAGGDGLVFAADDGVTGLEPWRSDGTAAGTYPLADISDGATSIPAPSGWPGSPAGGPYPMSLSNP